MSVRDALSELKPCPFCGSPDIDPEFSMCLKGDGEYCEPGCNACGATAPAEVWNRRTPQDKGSQPIVHVNSDSTISSGPAKQDLPSVEHVAREGMRETRLTDDQVIGMLVSAADELDATRVHEMRGDCWHATTIFNGDAAALRFARMVECATLQALPTSSGIAETTREGDKS